jgi:hypothetical protein
MKLDTWSVWSVNITAALILGSLSWSCQKMADQITKSHILTSLGMATSRVLAALSAILDISC